MTKEKLTWVDQIKEIERCLNSVLDSALLAIAHKLKTSSLVLTAGNGGSSSLASHAAQALLKPDYAAGGGIPSICLTDNVPTLTAHANDGGWETALLETARPFIERRLRPTLLLISSSGRSPNIIKLAENAQDCQIIAFTGFDGGRLRQLANAGNAHINSMNYEIIEPVHDALLHRVQYHIRTL